MGDDISQHLQIIESGLEEGYITSMKEKSSKHGFFAMSRG